MNPELTSHELTRATINWIDRHANALADGVVSARGYWHRVRMAHEWLQSREPCWDTVRNIIEASDEAQAAAPDDGDVEKLEWLKARWVQQFPWGPFPVGMDVEPAPGPWSELTPPAE